ncbi:hypothetical protein SAMN05192554_12347 [Haloarchaeobius iranensis]|uniref:Uncharacterized protein n=1 Tax=Haloarchaeobius iranensis TaxID=996166 RepID=A0A1H0A0D8_9EURY|nr:hypothetical protein SAMN05192554_12347 [Haloarchaeobius iranensis]
MNDRTVGLAGAAVLVGRVDTRRTLGRGRLPPELLVGRREVVRRQRRQQR